MPEQSLTRWTVFSEPELGFADPRQQRGGCVELTLCVATMQQEKIDWNELTARAYRRCGRTGDMTRHSLTILFTCAAQAACTRGSQAAPLRLGTTTTVEQSGALALFDSLPHGPVRVVVAASGTILRSAAAGDLDVVITHAPSLEQRLLIEPGHAALRCPFVVS